MIHNIRSLQRFDWQLEPGEELGWHVILGDNGVGKTTFLEAVALAMVGEHNTPDLQPDWARWLRVGENQGSIRVETAYPFLPPEQQPKHIHYELALRRSAEGVSLNGTSYPPEQSPRDYIYATPFASSFGPFRRFSGGSARMGKISLVNPLFRHLSLFDGGVAFTDTIDWLEELPQLKYQGYEEGKLVDYFSGIINGTGLLPEGVQLARIDEEGVFFADNGRPVTLTQLSAGPASLLAMLFEIVRQLAGAFGPENVFSVHEGRTLVALPGVVLIDHIEANLPPSRQQTIGPWLCSRFPNIQFIVTTYSQLVCKAAARGSVWRIPNPSENRPPHRLTGEVLTRLLEG
ncbi:MAG: AAA family ATPase [Acidobacteriota bacterium]|nr:AAA family ATPase [Acidobacteriota bacterium]